MGDACRADHFRMQSLLINGFSPVETNDLLLTYNVPIAVTNQSNVMICFLRLHLGIRIDHDYRFTITEPATQR
jgi:hypothetical protein